MSGPRNRGPIWTRPAPGSRQPRFTRAQIAEAAIAIADDEGFAQVSMRRVAEKIGAGTMTLYHYVRTKDDLFELMVDALMATSLVPPAELSGGWRARITAVARHSLAMMVAHPWAMYSLQGVRLGPNGLRHIEQSLAATADLALPLAERMKLLAMIDDYVFGHALRTAEWKNDFNLDAKTLRSINDLVNAELATGELPHMAAFVGKDKPAQAFQRAAAAMHDESRFEFGLEALLDGVERLAARAGRGKRKA